MKNAIYALCCLSLTIVIGGAVYEHLAVVPQWASAPPASLSMFQGEYGLDAAAFWAKVHPVTLILFALSLFLFWKTPARRNILIVFATYVVVLVVTGIYFVPELVEIISAPYADRVDPDLQSRAILWERLSLVRLVIMMFMAVFLYLGLTKIDVPVR